MAMFSQQVLNSATWVHSQVFIEKNFSLDGLNTQKIKDFILVINILLYKLLETKFKLESGP